MRMAWCVLMWLMAPAMSARAQTVCEAAERRQFDFLIGSWVVLTTSGDTAGTSRVEPILDGCVLHETWTARDASRGRSFSTYDAGSGTWRQTGVDNRGTLLVLEGGLVNGEMVLEGRRQAADGGTRLERITWTLRPDGSIRQLWQTSVNHGMRWTVTFEGIYRRPRDADAVYGASGLRRRMRPDGLSVVT